ncbi:XkdX family protein [Bacillus mojavensis]|uniref:XkdX family protein n=1 Tax=Bacillus mojavensis TaxID=72360 RepID=UPI0022816C61|nr:XkdX family protein [Bacillus mojavensis]MCY9190945.1 XkdX family protein [Bacillus mojavensis]
MNFWVLALHYNWASSEMVKQAIHLKDCSPEDLQEGIEKKLITAEQYKEITEEAIKKGFFILP